VRLNIDYPSNDAEYTWIRESFRVKDEDIKDEKDKLRNKCVDIFSTIIIWAVMILGITMNAVMIVSINKFVQNTNINISDTLLNLGIASIPFVFNLLDVKNMSNANIVVTILTSLILFSIPGLATTSSSHLADITPNKITSDTISGVIKAIGITILPYNGYQSVVQMSEEVKDVNDIPKGLIISGILAIALYTVLSLSVVAILGISKTTSTTSPIVDIFTKFFGQRGGNIANTMGILTGLTTLLLSFYSRSRLLSKISEHGIAPNIFSQLGLKANNKEYFKGIPINSVIIITVLSYLCTQFKKDSLEFFTDITNLLTCFVFVFVNLAVIYNYHKSKQTKPEKVISDKDKTFIDRFKETVPFYSVIGMITFSILLFNSIKDFF